MLDLIRSDQSRFTCYTSLPLLFHLGTHVAIRLAALSVKVSDSMWELDPFMHESDEQPRYPGWSPCTMRSWVLSPRALVLTTAKRKLKRFPAKYPCHLFDFVRRLCDKDKTVITLLQKRTWPGCHSDLERHTGQDTDTNLLQNLQNLPFISLDLHRQHLSILVCLL